MKIDPYLRGKMNWQKRFFKFPSVNVASRAGCCGQALSGLLKLEIPIDGSDQHTHLRSMSYRPWKIIVNRGHYLSGHKCHSPSNWQRKY